MLLDILQHPTVIIGRDRERNLGEGAAVLQVGGKGRFNLIISRLIFTGVLGRGAIASNGADNRLRLFALARRRTFTFQRSEEHTSELQSLMRLSYAVFCLKKKKTT